MARIKKFSPKEDLRYFETFINDEADNSRYFRITEFNDTFSGGKNGFLIEGTPYLKESTEIKIEILDVNGDPVYYEPGDGIPEYYEGTSKVVAVYVYEDTPIGEANITILGELKQYVDDTGLVRDIPNEWKGIYNVKWQRTLNLNKNLPNEDKVRFYRRPEVEITELRKSIFLGSADIVSQSGIVAGIPLVPNEGDELTGFTLPTSYRLKIIDNGAWTGSIEGSNIVFPNIDYSPIVDDVVSKDEVIVSPPYAPNGIVESFTSQDYSASFDYIEGVTQNKSSLIGTFAKIAVTDLKTFVGDVARVKVFRKSQSQISDFEFIQEIQLESNELLRDIETSEATEVNFGILTDNIINEYWIQEGLTATSDSDNLYNSAKLNGTVGTYFHTSQSLNINEGVEYTLDFNVKISGSVDSNDSLRVFLSGSFNDNAIEQNITTVNSSNDILQKTRINENIIANNIDSASLYFEVEGTDWYINNVSLKASQETSFSPDEIEFIQQVPQSIPSESFDYRFDFYDINSNFIPVEVRKTKTFIGDSSTTFREELNVEVNPPYFTFDSGSNPVAPTIADITIDSTVLTGSFSYTSGAYDVNGDLIPSSSYTGGEQYPGLLNDITSNTPFLTVGNFTGSLDSFDVQYVRYTLTQNTVSETFTISRVREGQRGEDALVIDIEGNPTLLGANPKGEVLSYDPANTNIRVTQGEFELTYSDSGAGGTFFTSSIQSQSIDFGTVLAQGSPSMSIVDFSNMTELSASVTYDFDIRPFFTSSIVTRSVVQRFTKTPEGAGAIEVILEPSTVNLKADESGFLDAGDYSNANSTLIVKQDEEYLLYNNSGNAGTFTVEATGSNISVGTLSGSQNFGSGDDDVLNITDFSNMTGSASASVEYNLTVYPYSLKDGVQGVPTNITRTQTFTRTNDGTSARKVDLTSNTNVVVYNQFNQIISPNGAIELTATAANVTGSSYFVIRDGIGTVLDSGFGNGNTFSYDPGTYPVVNEKLSYQVDLFDGTDDYQNTTPFASDTVSITGIRDGNNTYQTELSNPTATIGVTEGGFNTYTNTGTLIRGYKAGVELAYSQSYVSTGNDDIDSLPIYSGQFSASIFDNSSYIEVPSLQLVSGELYASHSLITDWDNPQDNPNAFITYKIDFENGESTQFVTQYLTAVFDGTTGPGIVVRGEWTGSIDYIYDLAQSRRDAVIRKIDNNGTEEVHYFATTENLVTSSTEPYTFEPFTEPSTIFDPQNPPEQGATGSKGWQYLGEQDFFVAAKVAIFEESFVENTINVGIPPAGESNAKIAIVGGTETPYISIGQEGTQGYDQEGVWLGRAIDVENSTTESRFSVKSEVVNNESNALLWDGENLIIRGAIQQLSNEVVYEPVNRGYWQDGARYYSGSIVQYAPTGEPTSSWSAVTESVGDLGVNEPPSPTYWKIYAEGVAGTNGTSGDDSKSIRLSSNFQAFKIDSTGSLQSPLDGLIQFTASLQNITSPVSWNATDENGSAISVSPNPPASASLDYSNFQTNAVTVRGTADGLFDEITIVKLEAGSDAITVVNTNQAHVLPASSNGTVSFSDYEDSGTTIKVYEGALRAIYNGGTNPSYTIGAPTVEPTGEIAVGDIDLVNGNAVVGNTVTHTNMTTSSVVITYPITVTKGDGSIIDIDTTQTITKGFAGTDGTAGTSGTAGATGEPGAGVLYRGEYSGSAFYYYTDARRDVVKGTDGEYYLFAQETGLTGSEAHTAPPSSDWDTFGATFESVATDILFSQDVYAERTINIGTDDGSPVIQLNADSGSFANPFISIGQSSESYGGDGIYIGYDSGNTVSSWVSGSGTTNQKSVLFNTNTGNFSISNIELTISGSSGETSIIGGKLFSDEVELTGNITANSGRIGEFDIEDNLLTSNNDRIKLDGQNEVIRVNDSSETRRFEVNTNTVLSSIDNAETGSLTVSTLNGIVNASANDSTPEQGVITTLNQTDRHIISGSFSPTVTANHDISYTFIPSEGNNLCEVSASGKSTDIDMIIRMMIKDSTDSFGNEIAVSNPISLTASGNETSTSGGFPIQYEAVTVADKLSNSQTFTLSADLNTSNNYDIYFEVDTSGEIAPSTNAEQSGYTLSIEANFDLDTSSNDINYTTIPSYTLINGGGFQSVIDSEQWFRVGDNSIYPTTAHIVGGLRIGNAVGGASSLSDSGYINFYPDNSSGNQFNIYNDSSDTTDVLVIGSGTSPTAGSPKFTIDGSGNVSIDGTLSENQTLSDIRLKENLVIIDNSLDKISKIHGYTFDWKETAPIRQGIQKDYLDIIHDGGLIANEVENILPELVKNREYKRLNYNGVIGLLVEGIKELNTKIDKLGKEIKDLKGK